jgi:dTMP kinase
MSNTPESPGLLVGLEGIDGSGKTTLALALSRRWRRQGLRVRRWREPSRGLAGTFARGPGPRTPRERALWFTLDRALRRERLERQLKGSDIVLSDRTLYSTLAYQGSRLGAEDRRALRRLQEEVARFPDLVILLDLDPRTAHQRIRAKGRRKDRFERFDGLLRVRREYLALARRESSRFVVLPAHRTLEELTTEASRAVLRLRSGSRLRGPRERRG